MLNRASKEKPRSLSADGASCLGIGNPLRELPTRIVSPGCGWEQIADFGSMGRVGFDTRHAHVTGLGGLSAPRLRPFFAASGTRPVLNLT
jgi:hypothetical protein